MFFNLLFIRDKSWKVEVEMSQEQETIEVFLYDALFTTITPAALKISIIMLEMKCSSSVSELMNV